MNSIFEENLFPIVVCDGFCGVGKAEEESSNTPYFYASSFFGDKTISFQPKHYFPLQDLPKLSPQNAILSTSISPNELSFLEIFETFQKTLPLEKIVLARRKTHHLERPFTPLEILSLLYHTFETKTLFAYIENEDHAFFGSTPENLYIREDRSICCDAIAGTTLYENKENLFTKKNIKEHDFVTKMIEEALQNVSLDMHTTEAAVKKAHHLCHIHKRITATLKGSISDQDLIALLHPTPATSGYPRAAATKFLAKNEAFDRDLYAGPLGWIAQERAIIKVALRCAMQERNALHLYAGAGIILESDPIKEIEEIENKFHTIEEALFETVTTQ